jgi:hypothetical protein
LMSRRWVTTKECEDFLLWLKMALRPSSILNLLEFRCNVRLQMRCYPDYRIGKFRIPWCCELIWRVVLMNVSRVVSGDLF